jgi:lambda family phage minor tail protein L
MDKTTAQSSIKNLYKEVFSLEPSALIYLFEIDARDLAINSGAINTLQYDQKQNGNAIFRFHNNVKLGRNSIFWQGLEYIAAPIYAEGFEVSAKGTLPIPKLSITSNEDGIQFLALLKEYIRNLDDLVSAKVTRIRTFAKYLDAENFQDGNTPEGFAPDPNTEFPRDVYYIDRKISEDKYSISFELASILDVEGQQLPKETVLNDKCRFNYRGAGCFYEYNTYRNTSLHGSNSWLPNEALPVANSNNEKITSIIGINNIIVRGKWQNTISYNKGDAVFIEKNGIKYYFVCKVATTTNPPPNNTDWTEDSCSKTIAGCKLRWSNKLSPFKDLNGDFIKGVLPFGGYPGVNKATG